MTDAFNSHFSNLRAFGNAGCAGWLSTYTGGMAVSSIVALAFDRVGQKPIGTARRYRSNHLNRSGLRNSKTTTYAFVV